MSDAEVQVQPDSWEPGHIWRQKGSNPPTFPAMSNATGRPPDHAAPRQRCQVCSLFASWLIPEAPFCLHHLPDKYVATLTARHERWLVLAGVAWSQVLADLPLPGSPRLTATENCPTGP
jgi:hypothetical protein